MKVSKGRVSYYVAGNNHGDGAHPLRHSLGVNALILDPLDRYLFSAGRDGVVAAWKLDLDPNSKPQQHQAKHLHTDWVNDIAYSQKYSTVFTASSDHSVRLWQPFNPDTTINAGNAVIGNHRDYAKALALPEEQNWIASGGLDRKIHIWDILEGKNRPLVTFPETSTSSSIYSLACDPAGAIIASGSPEKLIRIWDPRSGKQLAKLTGHTDLVRSILLSPNCDYILSASSDDTIKLWSLSEHRCIRTFTHLRSSVWTLHSQHPQFKTFYAGSRDGFVTKLWRDEYTQIDQWVVLCQEASAVSRIALLEDEFIWTCSNNSSDIHQWKDQKDPPQEGVNFIYGDFGETLRSNSLRTNGPLSPLTELDENAEISRMESNRINLAPTISISGRPGLIKHRILSNRRHVLTEDTVGEVMLWDIIRCVPIKSFGRAVLVDIFNELDIVQSVATWCTVEAKTGLLLVHLDDHRCFDAEVYADELGLSPAELGDHVNYTEEWRVNLGKWVLLGLFKTYLESALAEGGGGQVLTERLNRRSRAASKNAVDEAARRASIVASPSQPNAPQQPKPVLSPLPHEEAPPQHLEAKNSTANATTEEQHIRTPPPAFSNNERASLMGRLKNFSIPTMHRKMSRSVGNLKIEKFQQTLQEQPQRSKSSNLPSTNSRKSEEGTTTTTRSSSEPTKVNKSPPSEPTSTKPTIVTTVKKDNPRPGHSAFSDIPYLYLNPNLEVIITADIEEKSESPVSAGDTSKKEYRGPLEDLSKDRPVVDETLPFWLSDFLFRNRVPYKDGVKISFHVKPMEGKVDLPNGGMRLTANRVLRVRKILTYIAEKIEPILAAPSLASTATTTTNTTTTVTTTATTTANTTVAANTNDKEEGEREENDSKIEAKQERKPEEWLSLYCQNQKLSPTMTLATIRASIWKASTDVLFYYSY